MKPWYRSTKWWNTKLSQVAIPVYTYLLLKYPSRSADITLMATLFGAVTGIAVVAEAHIDAAAARTTPDTVQGNSVTVQPTSGGDA